MNRHTRRDFMGDVGRGMVIAGLGATLTADLGFSSAFAAEGSDGLDFGKLEPLVSLMQDTPPEKLQPILVAKIQAGDVDLRQLTSAAALANAETFGGEDYVGFHTAMAFVPAYNMARRLSSERQPLPVLKVLYRNSDQIQKLGGAKHIKLRQIDESSHRADAHTGLQLRDASRKGEMDQAERIFAAAADGSVQEMFNVLQPVVQDDINVHRYVLAHRAYRLIDIVGREFAHTLLRQSVRLCVDHERNRLKGNRAENPIRQLMPKLLDEYKLAGRKPGARKVDDKWIGEMCMTIYKNDAASAADAVAAALAEGIDPEAVSEAISLAANQFVLCQPASRGRVHGDSIGVHGSDAMNAWRNMARVTDPQLAITGLIVGGYHTAITGPFDSPPYPTDEHRDAIKATEAKSLLAEAEDAIRHNDQGRSAAAIAIYGEQGHSADAVFELMLRYTISEDGRLHGEKYFETVVEEFATTRPAFRWRQLVGLARVTASAYGFNREDKHGFRAAGYEEACRLLNVDA